MLELQHENINLVFGRVGSYALKKTHMNPCLDGELILRHMTMNSLFKNTDLKKKKTKT